MKLFLVIYLWITLVLTAGGAAIFMVAAVGQERHAFWAGVIGCLILGAIISKIIDIVEGK